jgi:hypothetical protein
VLAQHGSLGVDGKGQAPHWRLTELGVISAASAHGYVESPTNDFLRWDGTPFKRPTDRRQARFQAFLKKQNPVPGVGNTLSLASETPLSLASETLKPKGVPGVGNIGDGKGVPGVGNITSITTPMETSSPSPRRPRRLKR